MFVTAIGVAMGKAIKRVMRFWYYPLLLVCITLRPQFASGDDDFHPSIKPTLHITRTDAPIKIDGSLDDPGWVGAAQTDNFTQFTPTDMVKPPCAIEVLVPDGEGPFPVFMTQQRTL